MLRRFAWHAPSSKAVRSCLVLALAAAVVGCDRGTAVGPSLPPVRVSLPDPVHARNEICPTCAEPVVTVAEFSVSVSDPFRRGGTLAAVETVVENRSRRLELGRNTRPNASVGYDDVTVPQGSALVLPAGIVFTMPPPRDEVVVTVTVRLTDGREGSASSRVSLGV